MSRTLIWKITYVYVADVQVLEPLWSRIGFNITNQKKQQIELSGICLMSSKGCSTPTHIKRKTEPLSAHRTDMKKT